MQLKNSVARDEKLQDALISIKKNKDAEVVAARLVLAGKEVDDLVAQGANIPSDELMDDDGMTAEERAELEAELDPEQESKVTLNQFKTLDYNFMLFEEELKKQFLDGRMLKSLKVTSYGKSQTNRTFNNFLHDFAVVIKVANDFGIQWANVRSTFHESSDAFEFEGMLGEACTFHLTIDREQPQSRLSI